MVLLIEDLIRNISGPFGVRIRRVYYKWRLGVLGKNITIDTGVFLINPKYIYISSNVWIDKNCIITAGPPSISTGQKITYLNETSDIQSGKVIIGKNAHIGVGTIIQGHGGIEIGDFFTTSANCKIYSYSNDYRNTKRGTIFDKEQSESPAYIFGSVTIGENVWLGLNVCLISASIGNDVFVMPNSVVSKDVSNNVVAAGMPAAKIRKRFDDV